MPQNKLPVLKKKSDVPLDCGYGDHVLTGKEAACMILAHGEG